MPEVNGYNVLMVVVDKMGKLSWPVPHRSRENQLTVPEMTKLFLEDWVKFFGVPKYVIHDRDVRFTASFWKALWSIMGTRTLISSAYHP